jgi:DNA-binding MarR family transcriptional regulator
MNGTVSRGVTLSSVARPEDVMMSNDLADATDRARETLALLPVLRRWVSARVQGAGADVGLSLRQYAALHSIRQGASSPGELARLWQVTPAVITGVVDRLEKRELVRREPDPDDRRRLRLALTAMGLAASEDVERALTDDLAAQLATAAPQELTELGRALDLLQRTFTALDAQSLRPYGIGPGDDLPVWDDDCSSDEDPAVSSPPGARRSSRIDAERHVQAGVKGRIAG